MRLTQEAIEARNWRELKQYEEDLRYVRERSEERFDRAVAETQSRLAKLSASFGAVDEEGFMKLGSQARFIGEDGSLGYQKGRVYELVVVEDSRPGRFITISRLDGSGKCPYASLESFMRNWEPIKRSEPRQGSDS